MEIAFILKQFRNDFYKLSRISIIDNITFFLLFQLVRQSKVEAAHMGDHGGSVGSVVTTLGPSTPVRFDSRVCSLVDSEMFLGAE